MKMGPREFVELDELADIGRCRAAVFSLRPSGMRSNGSTGTRT